MGHPAHADDLPALEEVGPTQPSLALDGGASDMVRKLMVSGRIWRDVDSLGPRPIAQNASLIQP